MSQFSLWASFYPKVPPLSAMAFGRPGRVAAPQKMHQEADFGKCAPTYHPSPAKAFQHSGTKRTKFQKRFTVAPHWAVPTDPKQYPRSSLKTYVPLLHPVRIVTLEIGHKLMHGGPFIQWMHCLGTASSHAHLSLGVIPQHLVRTQSVVVARRFVTAVLQTGAHTGDLAFGAEPGLLPLLGQECGSCISCVHPVDVRPTQRTSRAPPRTSHARHTHALTHVPIPAFSLNPAHPLALCLDSSASAGTKAAFSGWSGTGRSSPSTPPTSQIPRTRPVLLSSCCS